MKRLIGLALLMIPCVALAIDSQLIPNPLYKPKVGDLCRVGDFDKSAGIWSDVVAAKDEPSFVEFIDSIKGEGIRPILNAEGNTTIVRAATRVKVASLRNIPMRQRPVACARIVLLEGPNKSRFVWVDARSLFHEIGAIRQYGPSADPRAESLLKAGQNLERLGKKSGAIGFYSDIVVHHYDSEEAKAAGDRIKALGGKIPVPIKAPAQLLHQPKITEASSKDIEARGTSETDAIKVPFGDRASEGAPTAKSPVSTATPPSEPVRAVTSSSSSGLCGATTRSGAPCRRRVKGGGYCYQHR